MSDPRFSNYTVTLQPAAPALPIDFPSVDSHRWIPGPEKAPYTAAGAVDKSVQGLAKAMPSHEFDTCDLLTLFDNIDPLVGLELGLGAVFRRQKREDNDVFKTAATAEHVLYTSSSGWACVRELSVRQDDERGAMGTVVYYPFSADGLALPQTEAEGDLTGITPPAYVSRYFQGPVAVDGQKVDSIEGFSASFGKNFSMKLFSGEVFPKCGAIVTRNPQFKFTTLSSKFNSFRNQFTSLGPVDLYLMREDTSQANQRLAKATANHIKISASSTELSVDEDSVQQNEDGTLTFTCDVIGTLAVSTTSNIPI